MNTTDLTQLNINVLTQEQYEALKQAGELDADALYMVGELENFPMMADYVVDNSGGKRVWKSGVVDDYTRPPVKTYVHKIPSMSYPANQATWLINVAGAALSPPTGYKAAGVLGASSNSGGLVINPIITDGSLNHVYGFVLNRTTSAITQEISVGILCIREDLI